jgi:hypothetical protein
MASDWRGATSQLALDLQAIFGARLRTVVAYGAPVDGQADGPATALALVSSLTSEDLDACASHNSRWERQGLATPLILPEQEFHRSLDVFPLEYGEIIRAHVHVFGADPFQDAVIHEADLRRACELQIKSHLLHLREGYMEARGSTKAIAHLVAGAAPAFASLLRNVAHLRGVSSKERMEATRRGAQAAGVPEAVVDAVLALEHGSTAGAVDAARLFPSYLAAVEQLANAVDRWAE